jgi:hypothetical protein
VTPRVIARSPLAHACAARFDPAGKTSATPGIAALYCSGSNCQPRRYFPSPVLWFPVPGGVAPVFSGAWGAPGTGSLARLSAQRSQAAAAAAATSICILETRYCSFPSTTTTGFTLATYDSERPLDISKEQPLGSTTRQPWLTYTREIHSHAPRQPQARTHLRHRFQGGGPSDRASDSAHGAWETVAFVPGIVEHPNNIAPEKLAQI